MALNVEQWIESVRQKPEALRLRYAFLSVAAIMVFVVGLWLLTVTENFQSVAEETSDQVSSVNAILPKPSEFSLDALLKSNQSLGTDREELSGEQYFQGQSENKTRPYFDEGVAPAPDQDSSQP